MIHRPYSFSYPERDRSISAAENQDKDKPLQKFYFRLFKSNDTIKDQLKVLNKIRENTNDVENL